MGRLRCHLARGGARRLGIELGDGVPKDALALGQALRETWRRASKSKALPRSLPDDSFPRSMGDEPGRRGGHAHAARVERVDVVAAGRIGIERPARRRGCSARSFLPAVVQRGGGAGGGR